MTELELAFRATSYEAAARARQYVVIRNPDGAWLEARFPTEEAAQAHALALNLWLAERDEWLDSFLAQWTDRRPDPAVIAPFFALPPVVLEPDHAAGELLAILDRPLARAL